MADLLTRRAHLAAAIQRMPTPITAADLAAANAAAGFGAARNTARKDARALVACGLLAPVPGPGNRTYRRRTTMGGQTQITAAVQGAVDPVAGERAKARGMAQANDTTGPDWAAACDAAIRALAATGVPFQAADLVEQQLVGEPEHPSMWGPRFQAAARAGVIEAAGAARSHRATVRASLCLIWRGAGAAA